MISSTRLFNGRTRFFPSPVAASSRSTSAIECAQRPEMMITGSDRLPDSVASAFSRPKVHDDLANQPETDDLYTQRDQQNGHE